MTISLADTNYRCSVVIHLGTTSTVAGFSINEQPKFIIPTNYYSTTTGKEVYGFYEILERLSEEEVEEGENKNGEIYSMINYNYTKIDFEKLTRFFQYIYSDKLKVSCESYPLVLTLPYDVLNGKNSKMLRNKLKNILVDNLKIPALHFLNETIGASLSLGRINSLVIDCGGSRTSCSSVIDGHVTHSAVSKIGGNYLDYMIMNKIEEKLQKRSDYKDLISSPPALNKSVTQWKNSWLWLKDFKNTFLNCDPQVTLLTDSLGSNITQSGGGGVGSVQEYTNKYTGYQPGAPGAPLSGNPEDTNGENIIINDDDEEKINFLLKEYGITIQFSNSELKQLSDCMFETVNRDESSGSSSKNKNNNNSDDNDADDDGDDDDDDADDDADDDINMDSDNNRNNNEDNNTRKINSNTDTEEYHGISQLLISTIKKASMSSLMSPTSSSLDTFDNTSNNNSSNTINDSKNKEDDEYQQKQQQLKLKQKQQEQQNKIIESLLNNVLIIGGSSLIPGFENRVLYEISKTYQQFKISTFANPILNDRLLSTYHAGVVMGNLNWELNEWEC